jgi:hypothetical protein
VTYRFGSSRIRELPLPTEPCKADLVDWVELRRRVLLSLDRILICGPFLDLASQSYASLTVRRYGPLTPVPEDSSPNISNTHMLFEEGTG